MSAKKFGQLSMLVFAMAISALPVQAVAAFLNRMLTLPVPGINGTLTLTGLIPTIYNAMDVVARELVGFIPAVSRDSNAERAAVNQTVRSPVVGAMVAEDLTPAPYAADTPNQTIDYVDMTITKARSVPFGVTGEEYRGVNQAEANRNWDIINANRIAQALRTLTNEVETDLAALYAKASRAYGTAGTTPFGTANDLTDFAQSRKILDDNGVPQSDLHMVLGGDAVANLRGKMSNLFKVNESNSDQLLRTGSISAEALQGFTLHNSAQVKTAVAVGTGSAYTTNTAGYAVGATAITLITGSGTVLAGDVVTFAGDTNKYVVAAGVAAPGVITLQEPGLRKAIPASATALTIVGAATRNMAFHRSAIQLATRAPAMPPGGDDADDVMLVTDPVSGITYEFCIYRQKRQVRYEVNLAWGVAAPNAKFLMNLLG